MYWWRSTLLVVIGIPLASAFTVRCLSCKWGCCDPGLKHLIPVAFLTILIPVLAPVFRETGNVRYKEPRKQEHDRYILTFLANFNLGKPRCVCPHWLKAPGNQYYHWGQLRGFRDQEQAEQLMTRCCEEPFDGSALVLLRDEFPDIIDIPLVSDPNCAEQP